VFETVLVIEGRPEALEAHLARMSASLRALHGGALPDDLRERIAALPVVPGRARLRIDVAPGAEPALDVGPAPPTPEAVLRPVVVPGGLGPHKWRDRRLLDAHQADDPATMPLLVDADGVILETSRANVVVRALDGSLYTPPSDGRILPGVTVAATAARTLTLTLADLAAADALYVTSALRGLQPAQLAPPADPTPTAGPRR
jgi:para-aminobenzoate synthetase/4-amino-4-deoxychorismate lyase